jgi:hypothetical protein
MAISAGAALLSTATVAATTGAFIMGSAITHFLVTTAIGAAINALTPKPSLSGPTAVASSGYGITQTSSVADRQIVYGESKVYGVRVFDATTGDSNQYLHRVLALTGHEIDSFGDIYINDNKVSQIDANGFVTEVILPDGPNPADPYDGGTVSDRWTITTSPDGSPLPEGAGGPAIRLKFHKGEDDQTADATLVIWQKGGMPPE